MISWVWLLLIEKLNLKTSPPDQSQVITSQAAQLLQQLADPDDEGVHVLSLVRVEQVRGGGHVPALHADAY